MINSEGKVQDTFTSFTNPMSKKIIKHISSYRLKSGKRPVPPDGPGGKYDGAFVQDYVYEKGIGTLDECNGCFTKTPEFPEMLSNAFCEEKFVI